MFYKTFDGQNIYYELTGNKKSDDYLIFLNGISQSTVAWNLMVPSIADKYQIILVDFIFQGQSDKQGDVRDFDQHASDIYGLITSLNIKKISLIGLSYGSLVAQHFALNYPLVVDKLILLSTFAHKTPYYEAIEFAWQRTLDSGGYGLLLDVMLPTVLGENYFEHPLIPINILRNTKERLNTDPSALKKLMKATLMRTDYRKKLKAIKISTLVVHGENDMLLSIHMGQSVADSIHGSQFEIISGVGHTLNLEAVPQTIKLINDFL